MIFSQSQTKEYNENGFIITPKLLEQNEIDLVLKEITINEKFKENSHEIYDRQGNTTKFLVWFQPPQNIYGNIARSHKIVDRAEELLGGEVYHWRSKILVKEAFLGGAWEWHQDYGYWYHDNCLTPELISCMIAINHCEVENGCLQVLVGSHKLGRIEHDLENKQVCANLQRVIEAEKKFPKFYIELKPGDALFFHCNLLHSSSPNKSKKTRIAFTTCYNKKTNSPFGQTKNKWHTIYAPIQKL